MRRRLSIALAGALVLLLALAGVAYTQREPLRRFASETVGTDVRVQFIAFTSLLTTEPHQTADLAPVRYGNVNPYAINVFLEQEVDEGKIRQTLEMVRAAGFTAVKQQMLWSEIETPRKGQYGDTFDTWAKYDRIVTLANEYGLDVILRIDTSPQWSRRYSPKIETPPDDFNDYGDFVETVVRRYRGKVHYYQIWNEPNLSFEWGDRGPDASEYARLLRLAYVRAKRADPNCLVISAALAPTLEESDRGVSDLRFLQGMYDAGVRGYFDVMSTNAYGLRHGPDDYRLRLEQDVNFARPVLIRELMVRNGDSDKPIWVAEVGWNALPANFGEEPRYGTVTRDQQARYTARAYQRAQEEWPWMGVLALWHFRMVHDSDSVQQQYYFNVVDSTFKPEPVYGAMAAQIGRSPVLYRGFHQEDDWRLPRPPGWVAGTAPEAILGGYERATQPGTELRFLFEGTSLQLVTERCPSCGSIEVWVDGVRQPLRQRGESGSLWSADLSWPADEWQLHLTLASDLTDGTHTAVIRTGASRTAGTEVVVDGLIVNGPTPQERLYRRLLGLAIILAGVVYSLVEAVRASRAEPGGRSRILPSEE